ncbi:helix-turn-helix domain-containing protein [Bacillus sp. SL00103]
MKFGAYLRALREEKKLSVNQLAMYSEVSLCWYFRIENGKRHSKASTIKN